MQKKVLGITTFVVGILAMWLVSNHIGGFSYPDYFYNNNPGITYYVGTNVVSLFADFSFFTYHTLIVFSLWCISFGIASLFQVKKLYRFCVHRSVIVFIFTNYLITTLLYTFFELTSGNITFGLYALNNTAIHNFGTNILAHYVFFFYELFLFITLKPIKRINKKHSTAMAIYLFTYLIYVKISGMCFYSIEWYPYPIFDFKSIFGLFGISVSCPAVIEYIIITAIFAALAYLYYLLIGLTDKLKERIDKAKILNYRGRNEKATEKS